MLTRPTRSLLFLLALVASCGDPPSVPSEPEKELVAAEPEEEEPGEEESYEDHEALGCDIEQLTREVRERIRDDDLEGAERLVTDLIEANGMEGETMETRVSFLLGHVRWLAGLDATYLEQARRMYVVEGGAVPRRAPGVDDADPLSPLMDDQPVDVWADGPDGSVLVALPEYAPDFVVGGDRYALAGWLPSDAVGSNPSADPVLDVGHPISIWRGPPMETLDSSSGGQPCSSCESSGLGFDLYGSEIRCVLFEDMCGSPGVTPPVYDLLDDVPFGCADCPTRQRSFVGVGDHCRGEAPGWSWQCAPDGEHLVCTAPGATPEAVPEPPPEAPTIGLDAYERGHPAADELGAIRALAAAGELDSHDSRLMFHAFANPEALFRIGCDAATARPDAVFSALRGSHLFDRFPDDEFLPCIERIVQHTAQLQIQIAEMPDPRLRGVLETIEASTFDFAITARAALALLDAEGPAAVASTARRLASEDGLFFHFLRSYVRYTADPRPIVPTLVDLLGSDDVSLYVRGRARSALMDFTGRSFETSADAETFWEGNRESTVDEWLVGAASDRSREVRLHAYQRLGPREPSEAGRRSLLQGLEEPDTELRYVAAVSLARWRDRRAGPVLTAFLPRYDAFLSLGWLKAATLGFGRDGNNAGAIARWREWSAR